MPLDLCGLRMSFDASCTHQRLSKPLFCHTLDMQQSNPEGKDGKEFVLKAGFPPKDLIGDIENSIQGASLSGEAITVRWK